MQELERTGREIKGTGHQCSLQVLRFYQPKAGHSVLEKRAGVLRFEGRQGLQFYKTRQPVHPPATAGAASDRAPRKPLGGGRQLPFGICRAVRWHGRRQRRRQCARRATIGKPRKGRRDSAAAGRFARRSVGRAVAAQAGRKSRRAYSTNHGVAQCRGRSDGHSRGGAQPQDGRTEKKSQNKTVTELENLKNHERRK